MRRAWPWLLLAGCSPHVDDLTLPLSRPGSLLVVRQSDAEPSIAITEIPTPTPEYLVLTVPEVDTRYWALFNECAPSQLGLAPGDTSPSTDPGAPILPTPAALLERTYTADDAGAWRQSTDPSAIAELRLSSNVDRCLEFAPSIRRFEDGDHDFRVLAPLQDRTGVFLGTSDGEFYLAYRDRLLQIPTATTTPHAGGYQDTTSRVWLIGRDGAVGNWLGDGFPFREVVDARLPGFFKNRAWVDGAPDGSEIFAIDQWGGVARFDGNLGTWTILRDTCRRAPRNCDTTSHASVAWLGPNEALVVSDLPGFNARYKDGVRLEEDFGADRRGITQTLYADPDYGLVGATGRGELLSLEDGIWKLRAEVDPTVRIDLVHRYGRAMFFGGDGGLVAQHHPGVTSCALSLLTGGDIKLLVAIDGGLVAATRVANQTGTNLDDENHLVFLDQLTAEVPACARRANEVPGW
jgi:hypothetical protein